MNIKKSTLIPFLLSVSALHLLSACDQKVQKSGLDIVGGGPVTPQDAGPEKISTVGLAYCTGTIIARDLILTAAHCYEDAVQGGYVLFGLKFDYNAELIEIAGHTVNPAYSGPNNDVAILKLAEDIPAGYAPVKLLPVTLPVSPGDVVRQAGYGTDNEDPRFGTLRTVDSRIVESVYVGESSVGTLEVRNGSTAGCDGDSGGPLYVQKNGEWFTAGVLATASSNFVTKECIGGNNYASVIQNYDVILEMARQLTGRQDPFESSTAAQL